MKCAIIPVSLILIFVIVGVIIPYFIHRDTKDENLPQIPLDDDNDDHDTKYQDFYGKNKSDAGDKYRFRNCNTEHPMCQVYGVEPDWSSIASREDPET